MANFFRWTLSITVLLYTAVRIYFLLRKPKQRSSTYPTGVSAEDSVASSEEDRIVRRGESKIVGTDGKGRTIRASVGPGGEFASISID